MLPLSAVSPPPFQAPKPNTFLASAGYAWSGLIHTAVHQRNMRMHLISGLLVALVGSGIPLGLAEKVTLVFCVLLVLFAEMLNSALEQLVDLAVQQFDPKAKLTKDIAAAGVLVLAVGTVAIFALVLVHNADAVTENLLAVQRQVLVGVPLTVVSGALMHERARPGAVNVLLGVVGFALWAVTLTWSTSAVFSAMAFGFLVVSAAAARARRLQK